MNKLTFLIVLCVLSCVSSKNVVIGQEVVEAGIIQANGQSSITANISDLPLPELKALARASANANLNAAIAKANAAAKAKGLVLILGRKSLCKPTGVPLWWNTDGYYRIITTDKGDPPRVTIWDCRVGMQIGYRLEKKSDDGEGTVESIDLMWMLLGLPTLS